MKRKGAIELATSTIVILVIAVAMLILGLYLVRSVMCGAINGVTEINKKTKDQIINLFDDTKKVAAKEKFNEVAIGLPYGVAFGVKGEGQTSMYTYTVAVTDKGNCAMSDEQANALIVSGKTGQLNIVDGDEGVELIRFEAPKGTEQCTLRYTITVNKENAVYDSVTFDVKLVKKALSANIC